MAPPDLQFFYGLKLPSTVFNRTTNGTDVNQSVNGNIYADEKLTKKIGKFAFTTTIVDGTSTEKNKRYQIVGTNVYFLPEGTLSNSLNTECIKDENGNFVGISGLVNVYQILSGSQDFLNSRGIIVQETKADLSRNMMVYFQII